jgi:hypothetical protein
MINEIVKKNKWFWAWQDEKEEAWLSDLASQGLHLVDVQLLGRYLFRKGDPAEFVYRLDFQSLKTADQESYLQLFADAGWEHVAEMSGWVYFRYKVVNGEAPEIYSDLESKLGKYQRILAYLVIFLPVMIIILPRLSDAAKYGPFMMVLQGISALIMLLFAFGIIQIFLRINRLKRNN